MPVNQKRELEDILKWGWQGLALNVQRQDQHLAISLDRGEAGPIGIVAVPESYAPRYLSIQEDTIFNAARRWWRRFRL
jgi:hypothetical protein